DLVAGPDDEAVDRARRQPQPQPLQPRLHGAAGLIPVAVDQDVRLAAPGAQPLQPGEEDAAGTAVGDNALTAVPPGEQAQGGDNAGQVVGPAPAQQAHQPAGRAAGADEGRVIAPEAAGRAGDVGQDVRHGYYSLVLKPGPRRNPRNVGPS